VHVNIGGDMGTMYSPFDPLFWLHHGHVDKLWWSWQKMDVDGREMNYGGIYFNQPDTTANPRASVPADPTNPMPNFPQMTAESAFRVEDWCYTYQELQSVAGADPGTAVPPTPDAPLAPDTSDPPDWLVRRSPLTGAEPILKPSGKALTPVNSNDLSALRPCKPIPDHWIVLNQLHVGNLRKYEAKMNRIITQINNLEGYVSPAAAWNRDDILCKIFARKTTVVVHTNGKVLEVQVSSAKKPGAPRSKQKPLDKKTVKEIKATIRRGIQKHANRPRVQKPIAEVVQQLSAIIGEPYNKDPRSPSNCYRARHNGQGFSRDRLPPGVVRKVKRGGSGRGKKGKGLGNRGNGNGNGNGWRG